MAVCRHADRQQSVDMRDFTGHVNLSQECYCRRSSHWGRPWSYLSPAIVAAVILGITGLIVSSVQPSYKSSWDTGQEDRTASAEKSKHHQALVIAASSSSDFIARLHTPRHLPLDEDPGDSYNEPLVSWLADLRSQSKADERQKYICRTFQIYFLFGLVVYLGRGVEVGVKYRGTSTARTSNMYEYRLDSTPYTQLRRNPFCTFNSSVQWDKNRGGDSSASCRSTRDLYCVEACTCVASSLDAGAQSTT